MDAGIPAMLMFHAWREIILGVFNTFTRIIRGQFLFEYQIQPRWTSWMTRRLCKEVLGLALPVHKARDHTAGVLKVHSAPTSGPCPKGPGLPRLWHLHGVVMVE